MMGFAQFMIMRAREFVHNCVANPVSKSPT